MSIVITHHAHHPDEGENGVYRLIYAEEYRGKRPAVVDNPDYDPENPDQALAQLVQEEEFVLHTAPQEIVWDAKDKRWGRKKPETIAKEQVRLVQETIAAQRAEEEARKAALENHQDLGTVGTVLE